MSRLPFYTALIFDTETTGLIKHPAAKDSAQPRIIEWGGVLVEGTTPENAEIVDELSILINPGVRLDPVITKITGLTDEDLKGAPSFADATRQIRPLFASADLMVAHNMPFDRGMMELDLARARISDWPWPGKEICTAQETHEEWGRRPRLLQLYEHLTGAPLAQTHRALDDVYALFEICKLLGVLRK